MLESKKLTYKLNNNNINTLTATTTTPINNNNTNSSIELSSIYSTIENKENLLASNSISSSNCTISYNNKFIKKPRLKKFLSINVFASSGAAATSPTTAALTTASTVQLGDELVDKNRNNKNKRRLNSLNNPKTNSKSLDDYLWPWKRIHKSDSQLSSNKNNKNSTRNSIKDSINSINKQLDPEDQEADQVERQVVGVAEELDVSKEYEQFKQEIDLIENFNSNLNTLKSENEKQNTNLDNKEKSNDKRIGPIPALPVTALPSTATATLATTTTSSSRNSANSNKKAKFQFLNNNKLTTFFSNLFHKQSFSSSSSSSSSTSSQLSPFTVSHKPQKHPHKAQQHQHLQQQQQQQQQLPKQFVKNIDANVNTNNDNQFLANNCVTYINPFFIDQNTTKQKCIENDKLEDSIYSSIDETNLNTNVNQDIEITRSVSNNSMLTNNEQFKKYNKQSTKNGNINYNTSNIDSFKTDTDENSLFSNESMYTTNSSVNRIYIKNQSLDSFKLNANSNNDPSNSVSTKSNLKQTKQMSDDKNKSKIIDQMPKLQKQYLEAEQAHIPQQQQQHQQHVPQIICFKRSTSMNEPKICKLISSKTFVEEKQSKFTTYSLRNPITNSVINELKARQLSEKELKRTSSPFINSIYELPNEKYNLNATTTISNEYSEPFDLLIDNKQTAASPTMTLLNEEFIQRKLKNNECDNSNQNLPYYYTLSQQSITSSSIHSNKLLIRSQNSLYLQNEHNTSDSIYSSTNPVTSSGLPLSSPIEHIVSVHNSALSTCSDNNNQVSNNNNNKCIISNDYETVSDCLNTEKNLQSQVKNEVDDDKQNITNEEDDDENNDSVFYESAVTTFDILNERKSELLEYFSYSPVLNDLNNSSIKFEDTKNESIITTTSTTDTNNNDTLTKVIFRNKKPNIKKIKYENKNKTSMFLERTLTFISDKYKYSLNSQKSCAYSINNFDDPIRNYIFDLSNKKETLFSKNITEFINCTKNSIETNPYVIMSHTRQFLNGIKNYLIKNFSFEFQNIIEKIRENHHNTSLLLSSTSCKSSSTSTTTTTGTCDATQKQHDNCDNLIFNVDLIIEECLQGILLKKLKLKMYYLLVDWLVNDNSMLKFNENLNEIKTISENNSDIFVSRFLGLNKDIVQKFTNSENSSVLIKRLYYYYERLQTEYTPYIKLKYVLYIINELLLRHDKNYIENDNDDETIDASSTIINADKSAVDECSIYNLNLNEFLPLVIYVLSICNMSAIQIEIDYIWGLMHKQLINNEAIYYLTIMSSACQILKTINFKQLSIEIDNNNNNNTTTSEIVNKIPSYLSNGLLSFIIANDKFKTINYYTIPIKSTFKTKDVCNLIAFKLKIFNNEDYSLYMLDENGYEKLLKDDEIPFEIRSEKNRLNIKIVFIYKQKGANIIWPKNFIFF